MPEEKEIKKKAEAKDRYEVTEIATQTAPVIKDNNTEEIYNEITILCKIANDMEALKKQLM